MSELLDAAPLWLPGSLAMAALVAASGFFSGSETALFVLTPEQTAGLGRGTAGQRAAASLLARPDRLLTAILFWNLLINLTYFVLSVLVADRLLAGGFTAAAGAFGLAGLGGVILFGEVLPKGFAVTNPAAVAAVVGLPLSAAVRATDPFAPRLADLTVALKRTFWPELGRESLLTAEDLETAVEAGSRSEQVAGPERAVLHNILDLSEIPLEAVMRPRGSYPTVRAPVPRSVLGTELPDAGFAALVEDLSAGSKHATGGEEVVAVIPLADAVTLPAEHLERLADPPIFLPWCATAAAALARMRAAGATAAVVVDEYGQTAGVATADDILDTVLHEDPSRARRLLRREPVRLIAEASSAENAAPAVDDSNGGAADARDVNGAAPRGPVWEADGLTTLRFLAQKLGLTEPDDPDPVTVAGLLQERLGRIPPGPGPSCDWRGWRLTVLDADGRAIRLVRVEPDERPDESRGVATPRLENGGEVS